MTTKLFGGGKTFQLCHDYQTNWRKKDFSAVMTTKLIGGGKPFSEKKIT
jgi:hypothetical protein